jgi:hypothetical protein
MTVKNIMICNIKPKYSSMYISDVLEKKEIAKVSSITLIPEIKNGEIFNIGYVDIDTYCDTEAAYEFIKNIKSGYAVFCHDDNAEDNIWIFQKNTHNSGGLCVGTYTTKFYHHENERLHELQFPIDDIDNYLTDEVISHIDLLNEELNTPISQADRRQIQEEIDHFENEIRIQRAVNNSYNVTLRPHQYLDKNFQQIYTQFNLRCERSLSDLSV